MAKNSPRVAERRKSLANSQRTCAAVVANNYRHFLAGVIGTTKGGIVPMIAGNNQEVVAFDLLEEIVKPLVDLFQGAA